MKTVWCSWKANKWILSWDCYIKWLIPNLTLTVCTVKMTVKSARWLFLWLNKEETADFTLIQDILEPVFVRRWSKTVLHVKLECATSWRCRVSCICQQCLPPLPEWPLCSPSPYPARPFTGQCPGGALGHAGEAKGQRPVRVGDHRAVGRAGVRGTRVHCCRAPAHQQAAVPVVLVVLVLGADHVAHPRPLPRRVRFVPTPAGLRRGAAEGEEARPVSAAPGAGCHRRRRGQ